MSTDEFLARLDGAVDEWTVTRDSTVGPDAARYQPDPPAAGKAPRPATGALVQAPLVCTPPYPLEVANVLGYRTRAPLPVRIASAPGRLLEYLWLWHFRHARRR